MSEEINEEISEEGTEEGAEVSHEGGLRRRNRQPLSASTKKDVLQHKQLEIKRSIPRKALEEFLRGAGAFAFTMLSGQLFGAFKLNLPELIARGIGADPEKVGACMTGAFNPVNDAFGKLMNETAQDSTLVAKLMMAQKLNMSLSDAAAIVDQNKKLVLDLMDGNTEDLDPIKLAKKMDISEAEARLLLDQRTWRDLAVTIVLDGGVLVLSIAIGGMAGLATAYLPISNPFAQQLVAAVAGQSAARLTQFFLPKVAHKPSTTETPEKVSLLNGVDEKEEASEKDNRLIDADEIIQRATM